MTMMTGEIEYDNLFFPVRDEITPKGNITFTDFNGRNITIPDLRDADLTTFSKAQYFPLTAHVIGFCTIIFLPIVIFNLMLGIAVSDIQVPIHLKAEINFKQSKYFYLMLLTVA